MIAVPVPQLLELRAHVAFDLKPEPGISSAGVGDVPLPQFVHVQAGLVLHSLIPARRTSLTPTRRTRERAT
jgi:hypothetical protein